MLDKLIVVGPWGMPQPAHSLRLTQIDIRRFLHAKAKPTTTYIDSPLTGAQIEIRYTVKNLNGPDIAYVEVEIPVASALVGHNHFHDGPSALWWEILCAGQLVRIALHGIGMTAQEIERYMEQARTTLVEITWHTACESAKARRALQNRGVKYLRARRETTSRHDVHMLDAKIIDSKSGLSSLVYFKSGDEYRQYCKPDQLGAGNRKPRYEKGLPAEIRARLKATHRELDKHARNELLIREKTLEALDTGRPGRLKHQIRVETLVDTVWSMLNFGSRDHAFDPSKAGDAAMATLQRFKAGEDMLAALPPDVGTKHRQEILNAHGPDIALTTFKERFEPANLGYQLSFERRWIVPNEWLDLVVSERTGPGLLAELQAGLAFLQDGEMPDIADAAEAKAWRARWDKFRAAQWLDVVIDGQEAA